MLQKREDDITKHDEIYWPYGSGVANNQIRPSFRTQKLLEQYRKWKLILGYEILSWWTESYRETEGEPPLRAVPRL